VDRFWYGMCHGGEQLLFFGLNSLINFGKLAMDWSVHTEWNQKLIPLFMP